IRGRAGLSYETALDVMASGADDEFGLRSAVVERARLAVRDVRPEPPPARWLPALGVAPGLVPVRLAGPRAGPARGPRPRPAGAAPRVVAPGAGRGARARAVQPGGADRRAARRLRRRPDAAAGRPDADDARGGAPGGATGRGGSRPARRSP